MKKILSAIFISLLLVSCYRSAPEPSFNMSMVLPADSMVNLLTDLHLADGILNTIKDKKITNKKLSTAYYKAILEKYSINDAKFEESMRYYSFHSEDLNTIYEKVIINLSKMESIANQENKDKQPPTE